MDAFHVGITTDTAHPQPLIPIYPIHSLAQPFCTNTTCWCHHNQARITELLAGLYLQELTLADAAPLLHAEEQTHGK